MNPLRPLKIGLLTHSVNPRGGVVHTVELATALSALGHDVTVFAPAVPGDTLFRVPPCRVVYAPITLPQTGTVAMVDARIDAFKRALLAEDLPAFDVLHAQDSIGGNALAELGAQRRIDGFVRTVHHLDPFDDPRLAAWQRRAYEAASQVLCVSDSWTHHMKSACGIDATTVPNGVDIARFTPHPQHADAAMLEMLGIGGIDASAPVVLAVGGIEARKNTLGLLDAFALLRADFPGAQLVIAGGASLLDHDAYTRRLLERVAALRLAVGPRQSVVLTGPLDDAVMPALFRRADVLSMVSLREGFGLVVLEALASGTPVVASAIAPFTEYLDDATCCWADPNDTASIANALRAVLSGTHRTDFAGAVPALLSRFSWRAGAQQHVAAYRRFVSRAASPRALLSD